MITIVQLSSNKSWQDALDEIQLSINSTIHRVTKASPLKLVIGKVARPLNLLADDQEIEIDEVRKQVEKFIKENTRVDKIRFDKNKAKVTPFSVGDYA